MVNTKLTPPSLRYKMSYKQLTTERKCPKIEFENYTYTVKRKNEKTQTTTWRCTDRQCKRAGKTVAGSFEFHLTNEHYHEANPSKKEVLQIEEELISRASESFEAPPLNSPSYHK